MAENSNYIGIAMGLDVTDLKAGLSEANKQIQLANSEFKAASSGMDDWTKSTEGLSAKVKQLDTVLKAQKSKLAGLTAEYEKVVKEQGEGSEAARKLQVQIHNQQAVVNKTEREFNNYRNTLEQVEAGEIDLEKVSLKAGKAVEKAGKQTEEAGEKAEDAGGGFTVMKGALASLVADGIKAASSALKDFIVDTDKASTTFQSLTGTAAAEMAEFNEQIEELYKNNYGESMNDVAQAMAEVAQTSKEVDPDKIGKLTENALTLRDAFGFEIIETMRAVNMLMDQFGISGDEAFNLIVQGAQKGLNKNGDLLDSINEYGVHYKQLGYTAEEFFNSLANGTAAGTFSVDKLGDAMKEFGIRAKDTATSTTDALKAIGYGAGLNEKEVQKLNDKISKLQKNLKEAQKEQDGFNRLTKQAVREKNAEKIKEYSSQLSSARKELQQLQQSAKGTKGTIADLQARFAAGGETARQATEEVLKELFAMEDATERNAAGVGLFGTMWEDLGEDAIKALVTTNGEISVTQEAMEELNSVTYSDIGTELKALGRLFVSEVFQPLAKKAIPKVKEFINWLKSEKVINKFNKALKWLGENGLEAASAIMITVGAFKALNATMTIIGVVNKAKTAIAGLTAGTGLATKAATAWNIALKANPIGLVVTAVGLLAGGIAALVISQKKAKESTDLLTESQRKTVTAAQEAAAQYRDTKEAAAELAAEETANINYTRELWGELKRLADENGKVKEGYEGRAQFILGQLNEALGTEYTMNGNIINQYGEIVQSIEDVIAAKQAEILLAAYEEQYTQAIKNRTEAEMARAAQIQVVAAQEEVVRQKEAEYMEAKKKWDEESHTYSETEYRAQMSRLNQKKAAWNEEKGILEEEETKLGEQNSVVQGYYSDIANYEQAHTLLLEGETDKAIAVLNELGGGFKTAASTAKESADEQKKILEQQVIDTEINAELMKKSYEQGVEGVTEEMVATAEEQAKLAKDEFVKVGGELTKGIAEGAEDEEWTLTGAMKRIVDSALDAARKAGIIRSPSRLMRDKVGKYLGQGVGVGILDSIPFVSKKVREFNDYVAGNLGNIKTNVSALTSDTVSNSSATPATSKQGARGNTVIDARQTINFNGNLSRRQIKKTENEHYTNIKMRLKAEGAI